MTDALKKAQQEMQNEENKHNLKVSKFIAEMDQEIRDRFKALKALQDLLTEADEEEQKEIKKMELEFEEKYKEIYRTREQIVNGKLALPADLLQDFQVRAEQIRDEDYDKLEVVPCDVKSIQNSKMGISDFWLRALLNHPIGNQVQEKDRPILGYLQNIELDLHNQEGSDGYDLVFHFSPNSYFSQTELKISVYKADTGSVEKIVGTKIEWQAGCDPTKTKKKKKKGGKKVTVEAVQPSFFNIFETLEKSDEDQDEPTEEKLMSFDENDMKM